MDFDPGVGTADLDSSGSADIFVSKLDSAGDYVWAKAMGGNSQDEGNGIGLDASGNVYTTGIFASGADFDPGVDTALRGSAGLLDVFVSKLGPPPVDTGGGITSSLNPGFTVEGDVLILTAPMGTDYQWRKDVMDLSDDAPRLTGTMSQQLTFDTALESDSGTYSVVYDDGSKALVQSADFSLSVLAQTAVPVAGGIAVGLLSLGLLALGVRRSRRA